MLSLHEVWFSEALCPQRMKPPKFLWIVAGVLFAAARVWIHYQVKVESRGARGYETAIRFTKIL